MLTRSDGKDWIPAWAGMTTLGKSRLLFIVIPAKAGIQETVSIAVLGARGCLMRGLLYKKNMEYIGEVK